MALNSIYRPDGKPWERIVYSELLIPDVDDVFGDVWTRPKIREFMHVFMRAGIGTNVIIDIDHDNVDVSDSVKLISAFIMEWEPRDEHDFIPGSFVLGLYIGDDGIWQRILDKEINGLSYEAKVLGTPITLEQKAMAVVTGTTMKALEDGHDHEFHALVDATGRVISGYTSSDSGHSHELVSHTYTEYAESETAGLHSHIYNVVQ